MTDFLPLRKHVSTHTAARSGRIIDRLTTPLTTFQVLCSVCLHPLLQCLSDFFTGCILFLLDLLGSLLELFLIPIGHCRYDPKEGLFSGTRQLLGQDIILLEKIHAFICTTAKTQEIGHRAHTDLGKYQSNHAAKHGCNISNPKCLSHDTVGCADLLSAIFHTDSTPVLLTVCAHSQRAEAKKGLLATGPKCNA